MLNQSELTNVPVREERQTVNVHRLFVIVGTYQGVAYFNVLVE